MLLLGLNAQLQGVWPKASLLSKACHNLQFYGIYGPYHNFSVCGDKWAISHHHVALEQTGFGSLHSRTKARGSLRARRLRGVAQHQLAETEVAAVFSASHRGWPGAETQPCLCNGQHPEVLGSYTALQLHPGPQVGKSFWGGHFCNQA